jgi:ABC-type glycerol-3-phosphate transport system permease component
MLPTDAQRASRAKTRKRLGSILFYAVLIIFMIYILLPIYYVALTAFTSSDKLFSRPLNYFPEGLGIDRYREIFDSLPIGRYMLNTAFLATTSTLIALFLSFLGAYAIARMNLPGANAILIGLLASSMLPGAVTVIPLFQMYQELGLMNTLWGLLLLYASGLLPITTWVLVSFIKQVPSEMEDAAKVDGAGFVPLLRHIVLPVVQPGMATMFLINFIVGWNEFFIPLIFARGPGSKVITNALSEAQVVGSSTVYYQRWGNMSAVAIIATLPVFIVTLVFQRQIVEGITSGVFK